MVRPYIAPLENISTKKAHVNICPHIRRQKFRISKSHGSRTSDQKWKHLSRTGPKRTHMALGAVEICDCVCGSVERRRPGDVGRSVAAFHCRCERTFVE